MLGETLLGVAQRHGYNFVDGACGGGGSPGEKLHKEGNWVEPKYGEGPACYYCHVVVSKSHASTLPKKMSDEEEMLRQYPFPEDMSETSRLACQISVTKECVETHPHAHAIFPLFELTLHPPFPFSLTQDGRHAYLCARRPSL